MSEPDPTQTPARPSRDAAATSDRPGPSKSSLVNAFSALLATEPATQPAPQQAAPSAPPAGLSGLSDAAVEEAVRRVLARMTEDSVRQIVVETAERLVREEIEKIKANAE